MIIAIGSQKGGVGKTTIATNLACWFALSGAETLLVDADDQNSAADFTTYREATKGETGYTLIQLTGLNVRKQLQAISTKYDHVIIDTGGRDTTSQRAAMSICDVFLTPFNPRSYDLWTVNKVCEIVDEIQANRTDPMLAYTFVNRADIKSQDNRDMAQVLQEYPSLIYLPHMVSNRKAFANSAAQGLSVFEMEQPDIKAIAEIESLFNAIKNGTYATATAN